MSTLARTRIRIAGDAACFDAPLDVIRHATPEFWRGNDVQFEIGVFFAGALMDVSNLASLTVEIRALVDGHAPDPSTTPLMGATVSSFDNTTTLTTWQSGANQHAVVAFTSTQSNIAAGPAWLSVFVVTNDDPGHVITLCAGPIGVREDGSGLATTPEPATETYYTAAQSDARFAPISGGSDILAVANGGTGLNSFSVGDLLYASGSTALSSLGIGSSGQVLTVVSGVPAWAAAGGGGTWGSITGTLSSQTDLNSALAAKAPLASPTFTGTVIAPTVGTASDSSTKVATTAFVQAAIGAATIAQSQITGLSSALALLAPLASPTFTGTPVAPTVSSASDSSTKLATTAFVQAAIAAGTTPAAWGSITGTLSSQTDLNSALAAKAPLASPTFTGTVSAPTPSSGDSSTKVATTAFVTAYTAPITSDGSGHYIFGSGSAFAIDSSNTAELSIYGSLAVISSAGDSLFKSTSSDISGNKANVINIYHTNANGSSAIGFGNNTNQQMGALGFQNYPSGSGGFYLNGFCYFSASQPYDPSSPTESNSLPPCGLILGQEGAFNSEFSFCPRIMLGSQYKPDFSGTWGDPWAMSFNLPDGSSDQGYRVSVTFPSISTTSTDDTFIGLYPNQSGARTGFTMKSGSGVNNNYGFFATYGSSFPYNSLLQNSVVVEAHDCPTLMLTSANASGVILFITGSEDPGSYTRGKIDSSGNWMIGTTTQSGSAILTVNGAAAISGNLSISTLTAGTWNGTVIGSAYGGTGVNNGSSTITLAGNLVTSGANSLTLTTTGSTNVTLPTSGTLVNSAVATLSSLASIGTIGTGVWQGTAIAITHGGTGVTSAAAAFDALSPLTTLGDIIYGGSGGAGTKLDIGSSGQVLTVVSGVPAWATPGAAGVSSLAGTSGQINVSGSTGSVTISLPTDLISINSLSSVSGSALSMNSDSDFKVALNPGGSGGTFQLYTYGGANICTIDAVNGLQMTGNIAASGTIQTISAVAWDLGATQAIGGVMGTIDTAIAVTVGGSTFYIPASSTAP